MLGAGESLLGLSTEAVEPAACRAPGDGRGGGHGDRRRDRSLGPPGLVAGRRGGPGRGSARGARLRGRQLLQLPGPGGPARSGPRRRAPARHHPGAAPGPAEQPGRRHRPGLGRGSSTTATAWLPCCWPPGRGRAASWSATPSRPPTRAWVDEFRGAYLPHRSGATLLRAGERHGLRERYVEAFGDLAKSVLARAGLSIDDIALVLLNHGDRTTHERTLAALGVEEDRSRFHYDRLAHQGNADTLLALGEATATGALRPGDHTLHLTSGLGFSWGATLLTVTSA
ncbi:hypothetical protein G5V59_17110 [Nocardioides sp. W3-2-3]|uniref:3-oxoacyl-[acyl-carrier-protein] synthase III C-terminal domain-containing protein n=1 Tax=Nocardioides convexus TaxID=2712224 RepID=UPI002418640A|nr:3-oxoacyl-[acyl-carrier-protein] synthase III C-terminal domain-containing protein [Nocardioides convexus]NHA01016.1 hypothetical protein [Nocardioides convexus]